MTLFTLVEILLLESFIGEAFSEKGTKTKNYVPALYTDDYIMTFACAQGTIPSLQDFYTLHG